MISFDPNLQTFHLRGRNTSYLMQLIKGGSLAHLYWGKRIETYRGGLAPVYRIRGFAPNPDPNHREFSPDTIPMEYPAYGSGDFREPAYQIALENGSTITDLRYRSHRILSGKPALEGLPATYVESPEEAQTLEITMEDETAGLTAVFRYTLFRDFDAIARSVRFWNTGRQKLRILRALSANVDFRDDAFDLLTLYGAWGSERNIARRPLAHGTQRIESARGASSHQQNPFFALPRKGADEKQGEVYGFSLIYSGNFSAQVQVDQFATARASIGINPFDFSWLLEPGESFQTPEAVMVFSNEGLNGMSQTYHRLYRTRLCRGAFRDRERPILINNWEGTYFDFNSDKILAIAQAASELGIELFVLDDGWFGHRDDDTTSLGDWFVNKKKLPEGLSGLAERINELGMKFGLWFEPEMVSPDSKLYRAHPDWCLHVPDRSRTLTRGQLTLDLSRREVCDYIIDAVSGVLASAPIGYVKWDMNRHMTEVGSAALPPERQRETAHRYMLGLYRVMETITGRFPEVLFESCSGGGGRFDPGILYYMPQTWTSDNTDAVCRLKIQYGTSIVYPASSMGSHVSAVPNHQVGRVTPLNTRGLTAMSGNFGYELDITRMSDEEKDEIRKQVALCKELRKLTAFGAFYRLLSPFEGNTAAWMFVSEDRKEAAVFYFRVLAETDEPVRILRLMGLNPGGLYRLEETGRVFGGDELMNAGLTLPVQNSDYAALLWRLREV